MPANGPIRLLDGDKIAALFAKFLVDQFRQSNLDLLPEIGVVQTAYANGASTHFLKQLLVCLLQKIKIFLSYAIL